MKIMVNNVTLFNATNVTVSLYCLYHSEPIIGRRKYSREQFLITRNPIKILSLFVCITCVFRIN